MSLLRHETFLPPGHGIRSPIPRRQVREAAPEVSQLLVALSHCEKADEVGGLLSSWLARAFAPCRCNVLLCAAGSPAMVFGSDHPLPAGDGPVRGVRQFVMPIRRADRELGAVEVEVTYAISADQRRWAEVVIHAAAAELTRIQALATACADRHRAEELERYVPGPISERIQRGEKAPGGEREVSVLFLDIRGYIARVSLLRCSQVFRLINRYVHAASSIVRRYGGTVAEFNGDGLMAVFGAPEEIPCKEQAAMGAALELAQQVPPVIGGSLEGGALTLGIGVASGRGFVGDVAAEDRLIWTALGNPTNLASRLQALTREFSTPVLVDEATWRGAGDLGAGFERHPDREIRGFPAPITVYAMRKPADALW